MQHTRAGIRTVGDIACCCSTYLWAAAHVDEHLALLCINGLDDIPAYRNSRLCTSRQQSVNSNTPAASAAEEEHFLAAQGFHAGCSIPTDYRTRPHASRLLLLLLLTQAVV
jgi:hypothetical protein